MKKSVILVGLLLMGLQMFGQYKIEGQIKNHGGRILLLVQDAIGQYDTLGNSITADGKFCFTGKVEQPIAAEIRAVNTRLCFPVFLENGNYEIDADVKQPKAYKVVGGGEMQDLRNEFRKKEFLLQHECDSLRKEYEKTYGKDDYFGKLQIKGLLLQYEDLYDKAEDEFLKANDNIVSASLLAWRKDRLMEKKNLSKKYDLLGKKAKATIPGCYVKPYAEKIAALIVGGIAPDLQMKTPDGKSLSIYGVKAKAKIIDFWASWCGPCRAENPNVKKVYEKYKSKGLEIIGVSLDVKVDAWRKAIETDGLPWLHMSDLKGWNSIVTDVYQIHGIPMLFVLDENNRIVGEGLRGEELEKCVQKVLAQ